MDVSAVITKSRFFIISILSTNALLELSRSLKYIKFFISEISFNWFLSVSFCKRIKLKSKLEANLVKFLNGISFFDKDVDEFKPTLNPLSSLSFIFHFFYTSLSD